MDTLGNKSKKKPTKIEQMTKEQIRQAILKKRECNARAQTIVENLLEKSVSAEYFLKCLPDINQSHMEDIIEERSIAHMCGYPLCLNTLRDIPKQKYRISLKTNKVYDITVRKNFCSNGCYKSAMHVKNQLLTSPLWFREYEKIPQIDLLPVDSIGCLGQEIDLKLIEKIDFKRDNQTYTSINDFTRASLNEINEHDSEHSNATDNYNKNSYSNSLEKNNDSQKTSINDSIGTYVQEEQLHSNGQKLFTQIAKQNPVNIKDQSKNTISHHLNIVGDVIERPKTKINVISSQKSYMETREKPDCMEPPHRKKSSITATTIKVEKCLAEWFTIDTLVFLFGFEKVKEMVNDKGEYIQEYVSNYAKSLFYNSNFYDQYQALCRKLNMLELEDRKVDSKTLQKNTKPLPDYSLIKAESKKLQLKVKAFYSGETELPVPEPEEKKAVEDKDENSTQLPLVDKHAQNELRRRIVCQHLNKVLPDLLRSLNLSTFSVSAEIQLLVNTFKLKANNIMFKPVQWTLIALVFIKLLSIRDRELEYLLAQPMGFKHMQLLLLSYKQDGGYLDRLISWLTDIDRMLDSNDTQLTIE